ncbi:hypothetical protein F5141DRAFT_1191309 [Pisolithus sp. B1]|nr:hypothetical protein F5141DRAFT_1191309 [Pisolithus sp. B1]
MLLRCLAHQSNLDADALCHCKEFTEALFEEWTLTEIWDEYGIVGDIMLFTNNFPRASIHKLISPDLLHQLIKGIFKDHLVDWVEKYLRITHLKWEAEQIMDDIDHCIAAGCRFKQWTGDDSKVLMKVYIAAIEGHVPHDIVHTFHTFLEFCYLAHHNVIMESALKELNDALQQFYHYHEFFKMVGVATTFSLPCQHSMKHYVELIQQFGAPNGLCSSMTENKHIKGSNKYKALRQMILTNQHLNKLTASQANFTACSMMNGGVSREDGDDDLAEADDGPTALSVHLELTFYNIYINSPEHNHAHTVALHPNDLCELPVVPLTQLPHYDSQVRVFNSASSRFYTPSDLSGVDGMCTEYICACLMWRNEGLCNNSCFSFNYKGVTYPCAVVHWFDTIGNEPDNDMGMWMVWPAHLANNSPFFNIIHLNTIYCTAHLIPIYGTHFISLDIKSFNSYDAFHAFYVNKYADHHAFETAT